MKLLTKQQLMAIDNMAILMKAKNDGLQIEQEDLLVNYSEIDHTLTELETSWEERASQRMLTQFMKWIRKVEKPEDLDLKKMDLMMQPLLMAFVRDVWDYGQQTADDEISVIEAQSFAEATGGKGREGNLTNEDAFEWYQLYSKELARSGQEAAFIYMQPLILEKLEAGTVRMELAQSLEDDFRRFGQVRTKIIARTESNKAFNWGRRYRFDKSPAIAGYRYSSILDERTTEICNYLHGHSWAIGDPGLDENTPPNHYQCRGLIVAINKYRSFTFDPPEAGWEDGLPDKEKKVYEKFKDSTYYPKADTVVKLVAPKMDTPKKVAIPKAPAPRKKGEVIKAAEIRSVADIKAWGDSRQIDVNLDNIPFDLAKDIIGRAEKTMDKLPILQEFTLELKDVALMGKFSGEYAHAVAGGVAFNPKVWTDVDNMEKKYKKDLDHEFHGVGTDHLSIVTHELGHVFERVFKKHRYYASDGRLYSSYAKDIRKKVLKDLKIKVPEITKQLSAYAKVNPSEFFAEAFAEWVDSPNPRPVAAAVGAEIMRVIGEIEAKEAAAK